MSELETLLRRLVHAGGFLQPDDVLELARLDRMRPVLVRCGGGRFTCPAQDVRGLLAVVKASRMDYVRDVSLPASDPAWRAYGPAGGR